MNTLGMKEVRVEGRQAQKNVCVRVHKLKHLQVILYKEVNVWIVLICKCTNTSPKISAILLTWLFQDRKIGVQGL